MALSVGSLVKSIWLKPEKELAVHRRACVEVRKQEILGTCQIPLQPALLGLPRRVSMNSRD
jgi:hypothetical protein